MAWEKERDEGTVGVLYGRDGRHLRRSPFTQECHSQTHFHYTVHARGCYRANDQERRPYCKVFGAKLHI